MNIQFHIDYQTYYGQDLVLNIITGHHNGAVEASQYRMRTSDGYHWEVEVKKDAKPGTHIEYYYSILCGDNEQRKEWGVLHHKLDFDTERSLTYVFTTTGVTFLTTLTSTPLPSPIVLLVRR